MHWLRKQMEQLDTDLLRQTHKSASEFWMGLETDQRRGADFGQKSEDRGNFRNGYRQQRWDSRAWPAHFLAEQNDEWGLLVPIDEP